MQKKAQKRSNNKSDSPNPIPGPKDWTHVDSKGQARMVNIGTKKITRREAIASGTVRVRAETLKRIEDNSIKKVLTREFTNYVVDEYAKWGLTLNPDEVAALLIPYLKNADAPGYFNADGFLQGGIAPDNEYAGLESNIGSLVPYNPYAISNLVINFK